MQTSMRNSLFYCFTNLKKMLLLDKAQLNFDKFVSNVTHWLQKVINRKTRLPFNFLHIHKEGIKLKMQQQESLMTHRGSTAHTEAVPLTPFQNTSLDQQAQGSQDQIQLQKFKFFQNQQQQQIHHDQIENESNLLKQQLYKQMNLRRSQRFNQTPINFRDKDGMPSSRKQQTSSVSRQQKLESIIKGIKKLEKVTKCEKLNFDSKFKVLNKIDVYIKYEHSLQKILRVLKNYTQNLLMTSMIKIMSISQNNLSRKKKILNMGTVLKKLLQQWKLKAFQKIKIFIVKSKVIRVSKHNLIYVICKLFSRQKQMALSHVKNYIQLQMQSGEGQAKIQKKHIQSMFSLINKKYLSRMQDYFARVLGYSQVIALVRRNRVDKAIGLIRQLERLYRMRRADAQRRLAAYAKFRQFQKKQQILGAKIFIKAVQHKQKSTFKIALHEI